MRKRVVFVIVVLDLLLGIAGGYALAIAGAASDSPLVGKRESTKEGFDGVVDDFAKLGGYESIAANCNSTSDTHAALQIEGQVIRDLRERMATDASLLNVAEAKLLARQSSADPRIELLLKDASWTSPSADHLREIIQELDHDQCRQVVVGGGQ